jgi:hypothetical protein
MNDMVACRAERNEITDRIDFVGFADFRQRRHMVDVDQLSADRAVLFLVVQCTGLAGRPVVLDAQPARLAVPLVGR